MLVCDEYNLILMPRSGTTFARKMMPWAHSMGATHDGFSFHPDETKNRPTYALVRDPESWYRSFYIYLMTQPGNDWLPYLGLDPDSGEPWEEALGVLTNAAPRSKGGTFPSHAHALLQNCDPLKEMREGELGLWGWWFLRCCGEKTTPTSKGDPVAPLRLIWYGDSYEKDMCSLARFHGYTPHRPHDSYRNSVRLSVEPKLIPDPAAFDESLLITDMEVYDRARGSVLVSPSLWSRG